MKIKRVLYLAIIVGLLVSMGAIPVLAEEEVGDIPMWVHRARLTYTGRSSGGPDEMVAYIHIRDAELNMVDGAIVSATWTTINTEEPVSDSLAVGTNDQGIAVFEFFAGAGDYEICVTEVTKTGWEWIRGAEGEDCARYWLPPYPYDSKP